MASSLGHSLLALAADRTVEGPGFCRTWHWIAVVIFCANAADLDFIPGLIVGDLNRYHRLASHSITALIGFSLICTFLAWRCNRQALRIGLWCGLFYATHLLLDWMSTDTRPPVGIPLLWPFLDHTYSSPFVLALGISHGGTGASTLAALRDLFSLRNLQVMLMEVMLLGPILALSLWVRKRRKGGATSGLSD